MAEIVQTCQPQVVFHLQAQPRVRRGCSNPPGTLATNVQVSLHVLEALKPLQDPCAVVMVTTDKVYENQEWDYGYRENDCLGGHDPYSARKDGAELAIATARAGNEIGCGDWAADRIVPEAMHALASGKPIPLCNAATHPWHQVLEPLGDYLLLAEWLLADPRHAMALNCGPALETNRSLREWVEASLQHWHGSWRDGYDHNALHEAGRVHLQIDNAHHQLGWQPRWDFATTVGRTVAWFRAVHNGASPLARCLVDLEAYGEEATGAH